MKPSEKAILDVLRKSTLSYLSPKEFTEIEKAVERDGILNLSGTAETLVKEAVRKHGEHDQASHGSWAGNGAGGSSGGTGTPKKISQDDMDDSSKQGSVATTPGVLDKLFGKGETVEGDEFERKVTEAWTFEMQNPRTGETFKAQVYDWMRYDDMGLTSEQGQKLAPMSRSENGTFSIATSSEDNAKTVRDYIASNSTGLSYIGGGTMSGDKTPGMTPFMGEGKG
jgi:hypothetical protein